MTISYEFNEEIDIVFGLLTDPQFLVDRCLEMGELEAECEVYEEDNVTKIKLMRTVQKNMPAFLAKLFNASKNEHTMNLAMMISWNSDGRGGWQGLANIEFEQQPVSIINNFNLYPTDTGCCYTIETQAKVKIPLIGRKVERFIIGQSEEGCEEEIAYLRKQLA